MEARRSPTRPLVAEARRAGGRVVLPLAALLIVQIGCLADIRPDTLRRQGATAQAATRADEILQAMAEAHGGGDHWKAHQNVRYTFTDEWPRWIIRRFGMPWAHNGQRMRATALLGRDTVQVEFLDGENQGEQWGIQNWVTYRTPAGGSPQVVRDETIWFWLPTVQYFLELPFRAREGGIRQYAGKRVIRGQRYDLVFVSWNQVEPQRRIDQYLLWVHRETSRLDYAQYTVRDLGRTFKGTIHYNDFHEIQGIQVPFRMTVAATPEEGLRSIVHDTQIESIQFAVDAPREQLTPFPDRRLEKDQSRP